MTAVVTVAAVIGLVALVVDIFVTVLKPGTEGFFAYRITNQVFRIARRVHDRRPSHRMLSNVGVGLVAALPLIWLASMWGLWSAIFLVNVDASLNTTTQQPSDGWSKVYFAGYSLFTSGLGDHIPGSSMWKIVTVLTTAMGLGLVTLAVTFLVPVLQGANARRACARTINLHGDTTDEIVDNIDLVEQSASGLAAQFPTVAEQHTSYPMLDHLHTLNECNSLAIQLDNLHHALLQVETAAGDRGHAPELRLLRRGLDDLVETITPEPAAEQSGDVSLDTTARLARLRRANGWPLAGRTS